jgi:hypothetical protein
VVDEVARDVEVALKTAEMMGVTPSGSGRSMLARISRSARTQSMQPSRTEKSMAVIPPGGRGMARGSELTSGIMRSVSERASGSAPRASNSRIMGAWAEAAAHMSAVCPRCVSRALTLAPLSSRSRVAAPLAVLATSMRASGHPRRGH